MRKGPPLKRGPKQLPEFRTLEEEICFWDTHDVAQYGDPLEPSDVTFVPAPPLARRIRARRRLKSVTLRLSRPDAAEAERIAKRRGVTARWLYQHWILAALRKEAGNQGHPCR
jgi:hypothetical protein